MPDTRRPLLNSLALIALPLVLLAGAAVFVTRLRHDAGDASTAAFVGRAACAGCHADEAKRWHGSHHDRAMQVASDSTVLGDFADASFSRDGITTRFTRRDGRYFVRTQGPDGAIGEFEVTHTFGVDPLQQYLIPTSGGRLQAFSIAWDTRLKRWFDLVPGQHLKPDDPLFWSNRLMNWNYMCADCHSTHVTKGYDAASASYHTTWSEIDVSCEACHGPGTRHVAWARRPGWMRGLLGGGDGLTVALKGASNATQLEVCGPCHSRRHVVQGGYVHGRPMLDYYEPEPLRSALYHADGQVLEEDFEYGSFAQSKMFRRGVRCTDCHDPHSGKTVASGNALCVRCHEPARFDSPAHHFHTTGSPGSQCVACHMPSRNYMVVHERHDHSLRPPRPDLTMTIGTPNACNQCHSNRDPAWAAAEIVEHFGTHRPLPAHYGETFAAAATGDPRALPALAEIATDSARAFIVRATAASLLRGATEGPEASALRMALSDPHPLVRSMAVDGLANLPPDARFDALVARLDDPTRAVRIQAVRALAAVPRSRYTPAQARAFERALAEFMAQQQQEQDQPGSFLNLGVVYNDLGRTDEAERAYRHALAMDSTFNPGRLNLAVFYDQHGRPGDAETVLRDAVRIEPGSGDAWYSLGLMLAQNANGDASRMGATADALERAAVLAPDRARVQYNAGLALEQTGRTGAARQRLERAYLLEPTTPDIVAGYAQLLARVGELPTAIVLAQKYQQANPGDPSAGALLQQLLGQYRRDAQR